jgi:hypothetical protein
MERKEMNVREKWNLADDGPFSICNLGWHQEIIRE